MAALEIVSLDTTTPQLRAPASGDTYAAPRALDITPETLTGSSATSSLSIVQTWNTTGTPTAFDLNVTDTASNPNSLLMNLRVGGSTRFAVNKFAGLLITRGGLNGTSTILLSTANTSISFGQASGAISWGGFTSAGLFIGTANDAILARDAANTLAQRNGVNAQTFNIYNTYTDASNYERLALRWSGNDAIIGVQVAGTGTFRQLHHVGQTHRFFVGNSGTTFAWNIDTSGHLTAQTGVYVGITEMTAPSAPPANGVRIFAQDNGAGKTQLMALFATGAAQQIAIEP